MPSRIEKIALDWNMVQGYPKIYLLHLKANLLARDLLSTEYFILINLQKTTI